MTLSQRGYSRYASILLLALTGDRRSPPPFGSEPSFRIDDYPVGDWIDVLNTSPRDGDASGDLRMIARVQQPSAFVTAYLGAEPVGIGRAVADGDWTGVFHMVTVPHARGRGVARLVLTAAAHWAQSVDAHQMYLQVERSNTLARRLYASAGFECLAEYHYRARSMPGLSPRPR